MQQESMRILYCLQLRVAVIRKRAVASHIIRTKHMVPESGRPLIPIEWVCDSGVYGWQMEKNPFFTRLNPLTIPTAHELLVVRSSL